MVLSEMDAVNDLRELLATDVLLASQALLGWRLVKGELSAQIVEVEAYRTPDDPACHAHRGITNRNRVLFGQPGFAYVYFTYGHHWMFNISAHPEGIAAAVLIRAAKPLAGLEAMRLARGLGKKDYDLLSGPGKICQAFGIDRADNGRALPPLTHEAGEPELRLEPGSGPVEVIAGPRVGIAPGKGDELPWRFIDRQESEWASRPRPTLP